MRGNCVSSPQSRHQCQKRKKRENQSITAKQTTTDWPQVYRFLCLHIGNGTQIYRVPTYFKISHYSTRFNLSHRPKQWEQFPFGHILWQIVDNQICQTIIAAARQRTCTCGRHVSNGTQCITWRYIKHTMWRPTGWKICVLTIVVVGSSGSSKGVRWWLSVFRLKIAKNMILPM